MATTYFDRTPTVRRAAVGIVGLVWGATAVVSCGRVTAPAQQKCFVGGAYGSTDSTAGTRLRVENGAGMGLWIKVRPTDAAYTETDLAVYPDECAEWAFSGAAANLTVEIRVQGCELTTRVADTCGRPFSAAAGVVLRTMSEGQMIWYVVGEDSFRPRG